MELQFKKKTCSYVSELVSQCKEQELTDEIRLSDNMTDIGRVLGAWGQVLIRGKEWRPDRVAVSGGVMVWVMYIPENSNQPEMVETWLPFHEQWPIADTQHDGSIIVTGHLTFCDARSVSARKLMLRTGLCLDVHVYAPDSESIYSFEELPENVQVQVVSHRIMLPAEAGEKSFSMEEQLPIPSDCPKLQKLLRYNLLPQVMEVRVSGGRVIFRGVGTVHVVGMDEDGQLHSFDTEVPFSQYAQLDREYEEGAEAIVRLAVTNFELETVENQMLNMKLGLSGQYVIQESRTVDVVQDAYCPGHELELNRGAMNLPVVLQEHREVLAATRPNPCDGVRIADADFVPGMPEARSADGGTELLLSGRFCILYYDRQGQVQNMTVKWEQEQQLTHEKGVQVRSAVMPCGKVDATLNEANGQLQLEYTCCSSQGLEMLTGISMGQVCETEEDRPAMVVRKAGRESLWTIAKKTGSTVEAIRSMNGIPGEPDPEQVLLIPII